MTLTNLCGGGIYWDLVTGWVKRLKNSYKNIVHASGIIWLEDRRHWTLNFTTLRWTLKSACFFNFSTESQMCISNCLNLIHMPAHLMPGKTWEMGSLDWIDSFHCLSKGSWGVCFLFKVETNVWTSNMEKSSDGGPIHIHFLPLAKYQKNSHSIFYFQKLFFPNFFAYFLFYK